MAEKLPSQFRFTPLEVFEWHRDMGGGEHKLMGQYLPGMTYNCTSDSRHDALRAMCEQWAEEGKIEVIGLTWGQVFKREDFVVDGSK